MKFTYAAITVVLALMSGQALAAPGDSVDNAYKLCSLMDGTNMLSQPCDVSGWGSSVNISVDASAAEARKLCPSIGTIIKKYNLSFDQGWTLKISSPYSGDKSIAVCRL